MTMRWRTWRSRTFLAALLCLGITAGAYSWYGYDSFFLYSCCLTFYVLALLAHALAGRRSAAALLVLGAVWAFLAVNNARFCVRVPAMLGELERARGWVPHAEVRSIEAYSP
jgi:hypothetical protein